MKNLKRRVLSIFLVALITICLVGCAKSDLGLLNEKVVAMIDLSVEHNSENGFSMLYPGVTDIATYRSTAKMIDDYFPVTADYTWELQQWNVMKGIGSNPTVIYKGQYKVEFDGKVFYIYVTWQSDSDGEGFTQFQIVSEEDLNAAKNT